MHSLLRQSLSLGKVAGIPIGIHWTFLLIVIWIFVSSLMRGQSMIAAGWTVLFILVIFGCVFLHELGHALAARRYGIQTKSIILLPVGGVASMDRIPTEPMKELVIALAGPAVNVVIALVLFLYFFLTGTFEAETLMEMGITRQTFFAYLMLANIVLGVFNLIPAFPMDGGRVLRALLSFKMDREQATGVAVRVATVFAILFALWGIFSNPILVFIALFVFLGARAEYGMVQSQTMLSGFTVRDVLMKEFSILDTNLPVSEAVKKLLNSQETRFLVEENKKVTAVLTKTDIIRALSEQGENRPIRDFASPIRLLATPESDLEKLYESMISEGLSLAPVMEGDRLIGMVDIDNIQEFLLLRKTIRNRN